jgi:glycerophosphoryl diester phosphodiesterase
MGSPTPVSDGRAASSYALVGHRGAKGLAPENTMAGFRLAEEIGVEQLEFDVRLTADGVAIVIHDATLDRTAVEESGRNLGPIAELTLEQIKRVDVGGGESVPTLEELLDGTSAALQLEIKAVEACGEIARILNARPADAARTRIISFKAEALARMRDSAPQIPRGFLTMGYPDKGRCPNGIEAVLAEVAAEMWHCCAWEGMTAELADQMRADGYQIMVGPLRTIDDMRRAIDLGAVSGAIDDPRAGVAWREQLASEG